MALSDEPKQMMLLCVQEGKEFIMVSGALW
jgi:hypothetical protein